MNSSTDTTTATTTSASTPAASTTIASTSSTIQMTPVDPSRIANEAALSILSGSNTNAAQPKETIAQCQKAFFIIQQIYNTHKNQHDLDSKLKIILERLKSFELQDKLAAEKLSKEIAKFFEIIEQNKKMLPIVATHSDTVRFTIDKEKNEDSDTAFERALKAKIEKIADSKTDPTEKEPKSSVELSMLSGIEGWSMGIDSTQFRFNTLELFSERELNEHLAKESKAQGDKYDDSTCRAKFIKENSAYFTERFVGDSDYPRIVSNFNLPQHMNTGGILNIAAASLNIFKDPNNQQDMQNFFGMLVDHLTRGKYLPTVPVDVKTKETFQQAILNFLKTHPKSVLADNIDRDLVAKTLAEKYIAAISADKHQEKLCAIAVSIGKSLLAARSSNTPITISGKEPELVRHVWCYIKSQNLGKYIAENEKIICLNTTHVKEPDEKMVEAYKNTVETMLNKDETHNVARHLTKSIKQLEEKSQKELPAESKETKEIAMKIGLFPQEALEMIYSETPGMRR